MLYIVCEIKWRNFVLTPMSLESINIYEMPGAVILQRSLSRSMAYKSSLGIWEKHH